MSSSYHQPDAPNSPLDDSDSDLDLGLAYDGEHPFSIAELADAARELDDRHREGLVTRIGEWGAGVNGGAWMLIEDEPVDFLYRDLNRVREAVEDCLGQEGLTAERVRATADRLAAATVASGPDAVTPLCQYQVPRPDLGRFDQLLAQGDSEDGR